MTEEKQARIEALKGIGKLAGALAGLAIAGTAYYEVRTAGIETEIERTQAIAARETATSSAAYAALVERLELHEDALRKAAEERASIRVAGEKRAELLVRHDERINIAIQRSAEPIRITEYVVESNQGAGIMGPDEEDPLAELSRRKLKKERPRPKKRDVAKAAQQFQQHALQEGEVEWAGE